MKSIARVAPRRNLVPQARFIQVERKDLTNKHSIVQKAGTTQNKHLETLLDNNKRWVAAREAEDPDFFHRLGQGQKPRYLYFGCSDSRVPANQILGLE